MFSTTGLFKNVACPSGDKCTLLNCIFSHELLKDLDNDSKNLSKNNEQNAFTGVIQDDTRQPKKRKRDDEESAVNPALSVITTSLKVKPGPEVSQKVKAKDNTTLQAPARDLTTLRRDVSPPSRKTEVKSKPVSSVAAPPRPVKVETLNPRMLPQAPLGHDKRTLYVKHLHDSMSKLNDQAAKSPEASINTLMLDRQQLITAALDEEEQMARTNSGVYANVMKNRIAALKKMNVEQWTSWVKEGFLKTKKAQTDLSETKEPPPPPPLDTGLPIEQEHLLLSSLITDQRPLANHGYVISPPTQEQIRNAQKLTELAGNFEVCDRCKTRFQVFPDRREEDGALTTNGPCVHHWGRTVYPRRQKTDTITGAKEPEYSCCGEPLNAKGCSSSQSHVYKIQEPARMAAVTPFIWTPSNDEPLAGPDGRIAKGVTFDCEMGYTTYGMELIRLTAVSWPQGNELVDVIVRPKGTVLDLNSRFSGVWPETYQKAFRYGSVRPPAPKKGGHTTGIEDGKAHHIPAMPLVDSPEAARALLCSFLTPETPLIGHALENDLNSVRLCHPTIIDTVVVFPHNRGLPLRFGLKMLTKKYLLRDIQMGGEMGHDSLEDSRATGDLVRYAVGKEWKRLESEGWTIRNDGLMPPLPPDMPSEPPAEEPEGRVLGASSGVKRQRIQVPASGSI